MPNPQNPLLARARGCGKCHGWGGRRGPETSAAYEGRVAELRPDVPIGDVVTVVDQRCNFHVAKSIHVGPDAAEHLAVEAGCAPGSGHRWRLNVEISEAIQRVGRRTKRSERILVLQLLVLQIPDPFHQDPRDACGQRNPTTGGALLDFQ